MTVFESDRLVGIFFYIAAAVVGTAYFFGALINPMLLERVVSLFASALFFWLEIYFYKKGL